MIIDYVLCDLRNPGRLWSKNGGHSSLQPALCKSSSTFFDEFLYIMLIENILDGHVMRVLCSEIASIGPL